MKTQSNTAEQRSGVQVIARAARILRALEGRPEGLSLGAIAKQVDLPRSTVQRMVGALTTERFVTPATPNARVRLGPGLVPLVTAANADFNAIVRPYMQELSEELRESVNLSMLDGKMMMFIDEIWTDTHQLSVTNTRVGMTFNPYDCAHGKAVLAQLSDDELDNVLPDRLIPRTQRTMTSKAAIKEQLQEIREEGVAFSQEEHELGTCAVATFLRDPFGRKLALSVPVPSIRFYGSQHQLVDGLKKHTTAIEMALGNLP